MLWGSVKKEKMVHIIEYINKKKYIWDTKMGRWWRVPGEQKKEKNSGKREKEKWRWTGRSKKEKEIQARYIDLVGDPQISENYLIPYQEAPVCECIREIAHQLWGDLRFQAMALLALQEAVEAYIINLFEDFQFCAIHGQHITVIPKDIQLAWGIQGDMVRYLPNVKKYNNILNTCK